MTQLQVAVRLSVKASASLTVFLCVVHAMAAALLVPLDIGVWPKLLLGTAVAVSLARNVWRHGLLRAKSSILCIEASERGRAVVLMRNGRRREVEILGTTYVSARLTVLNLRESGSLFTQHVILVPDNVDPEEFRQLRVVLRWGRASPVS
jgi:toxin CptA